MHKTIRDSVLFCETASEMWKELEERYGQSNKARLFPLQEKQLWATTKIVALATFSSPLP